MQAAQQFSQRLPETDALGTLKGLKHEWSSSLSLREMQAARHPNCVVCAAANLAGLGLDFRIQQDEAVEADFGCPEALQGYPGILHGGVIATVLDGAMANCLFTRRIEAVTADLRIRYRHPVSTGTKATVRAWPEESHRALHVMRAQLFQDGQIKATATAKFVELTPGTAAENGCPSQPHTKA
ncbi:MAG: PaaI family thioesterase [Lentisphaerae bacterium]|jgi:uncharacterized protein (TIGR00369 family)|nr:PaaI family thioesterase [Lentisphaerota bacterium]MBT4823544.1 PaaI family thioesterase [Lentisphaerota bacterium]MBT5612702.1 PaaI family thioesterase [Lentisphaerota bacterium]MBT7060337.1 PaaI family thioesterase [Lentisphaerota bacterium]MBT7845601.1 PaaI family thioesterase [Lentisphaerota bacterium]